MTKVPVPAWSLPAFPGWMAGAWLLATPLAAAAGPPDLLGMAARGYNYPEFKAALDALPPDAAASLRDANGRTLLHHSAGGIHQQGVLLTLLAGVDVNARDAAGVTPIFDAAAWNGECALMIVEMLTLRGAEINVRDRDGYTPLAVAVRSGNLRVVDLLLGLGADPRPAGAPEAVSPLNLARQRGDPRFITLLESAAPAQTSPPATAPAGVRPPRPARVSRRFAEAVRAADLNAIAALVADGHDVNVPDAEGNSALWLAAADHRPDLVTLLLLEGADANTATRKGVTPLMEAARWLDFGGERMLSLLLLAGADPNAVAQDGHTAMSKAVANGNEFAVHCLLWRGAGLDVHTPDGPLWEIARKEDWPPVTRLLQQHGLTAAPAPPVRRETALIEAAKRGDLATLEAELARGIPADAPDESDRTALEWAATFGRFDAVDVLLRHGADINCQLGPTGIHAVHGLAVWGAGSGNADVAARHITALLQRGLNPNLRKRDGTTPLMAAARKGVTGANTHVLLTGGADVNARDASGRTALTLARQYGHAGMVQLLLEHGGTE